jgi:gliding motility-associated-like protein
MKLSKLFLAMLLSGVAVPSFGQFFNMNPPTITGQRPTPLITEKNTSITIAFQNLRVSDPDIFMPAYPQGYTLAVFPGDNYTLANRTVTPSLNFVGTLTVQVQVNDGRFDSNVFDLKIDVTNIKPEIVDQQNLTVKEGSALDILLSHLEVDDDDNAFPQDFTLTVYDDANFSVIGNRITPDPNFTGNLKVPVSVNDGHEESDQFELKVQVKPNDVPEIQGQDPNPIATVQGKNVTLEFSNLKVKDTDNAYPTGFSLTLYPGSNYTVDGNSIVPDKTYVGTLRVPVTVNDGLHESKKYEVKIEVAKKNNVVPRIDSQDNLTINEDESITIALENLRATDADNDYPQDFLLKVPQGRSDTYTVSGNKITPVTNYYGGITINIRVNDGLDDSPLFPLKINVASVNDKPVITGQEQITVRGNRATQLDVSRLKITDPDNSTFTVKILPGTNYTGVGNALTPATDFVGTLTVRVVVNDGAADSSPFNLKVEVEPAGSDPLITGQQPLAMDEDQSITLTLEDLYVTDDDDNYPTGFTMKIFADSAGRYTFQNLTVTPKLNMNGPLSVYVSVNDGNENSNIFPLKIYVIPVNDAPQITKLENTTLTYEPGSGPSQITSTLTGEDIDNAYLSFAEVGIVDSVFNPLHDELIFDNTELIRGVYDPSKGILSLIGNATKVQYDSAIRSVTYNYRITIDENGNQSEIIPGSKHIYFTISDGQHFSEKQTRTVTIESVAELDIPNAFTPNGDEVNPTWRVRPLTTSSRFDKALVKVYNVKGVMVYEGRGFTNSWDGTFNGDALPTGTYYYTIDLQLSYTKKTYKGTVTILR